MNNTHSLSLVASSSQYTGITNASQSGLSITSNITLENWVKLSSSPGSGSSVVIMGKRKASTLSGYSFQYRNTGGVYALRLIVSNGSQDVLEKDTTLSHNVWYHLAVVWTASTATAEFFVDGVSIGTSVGAITTMSTNDVAFRVGATETPGNYFDGLLNNIRVWNGTRTEAQISANKKRVLISATNLISSWYAQNSHNDLTSTGNNLTAVNTPTFNIDVPFKASGAFFQLL